MSIRKKSPIHLTSILMKKFIAYCCCLMSLGSLILPGCASDENDDIVRKTEIVRYLTIHIMNAGNGGSRADSEFLYVDGSETESAIHSVYLYFFDKDGNPSDAFSSVEGVSHENNWILINPSVSSDRDEWPNVERQLTATLAFKGDEDIALPASAIAVINMKNPDFENLKLSDFDSAAYQIPSRSEEGIFIMASAVHVADGLIKREISVEDKLESSESLSLANPVNIYVERVDARVDIVRSAKHQDWNYTLTDHRDITAQILGWQLTVVPEKSNVVKNLDEKWIDTPPLDGWTNWNRPSDKRCFWAKMPDETLTVCNGLKTMSFNDIVNADMNKSDNKVSTMEEADENYVKSRYTLENTLPFEGEDNIVNTKLIVACRLLKDNKPYSYYRYMAMEIDSEEGVRNAICITFKGKYYVRKTTDLEVVYTDLGADDIELFTPEQVGYRVADDAHAKDSYGADEYGHLRDYEVVGKLKDGLVICDGNKLDSKEVSSKDINAELAFYPASVCKDGLVYYFVDIMHLDGVPGVVRNHIYELEIHSITGLGSPVFDPSATIIPMSYKDEKSYVAARIKVLAWRIVRKTYDFGG